MRLQIGFRNEAAGLAINGVQRPGRERGMQWDSQGLPFASRQRSSHLAMTAPRTDDVESEPDENCRNIAARQLLKPQ